MQYLGINLGFIPRSGANDNDDLLALSCPDNDLAFVRLLKQELRAENAVTGMLLNSRKQRRFFEETLAAERYILLRYFSVTAPETELRRLRRHILDCYLFPKPRRRRKPKH